MKKVDARAKEQILRELMKEGGSLSNLAERTKSNESPTYNSAKIKAASKRTAERAAENFNRVSTDLVASGR